MYVLMYRWHLCKSMHMTSSWRCFLSLRVVSSVYYMHMLGYVRWAIAVQPQAVRMLPIGNLAPTLPAKVLQRGLGFAVAFQECWLTACGRRVSSVDTQGQNSET